MPRVFFLILGHYPLVIGQVTGRVNWLVGRSIAAQVRRHHAEARRHQGRGDPMPAGRRLRISVEQQYGWTFAADARADGDPGGQLDRSVLEAVEHRQRSEEHTSELQSLMRISYAVLCLTKNTI